MTPVRTLREFRLLGREWLSLWWQFLPALGFWFCVGRIGLELGALGATFLRPDTGPGAALAAVGIPTRAVATLVFILGLIVHVVCLVMMIASTGTGLRSARDPHLRSAVPGQFTEHRTRRDIIVETVAPFLRAQRLHRLQHDRCQIPGLDHATSGLRLVDGRLGGLPVMAP